MTLFHASFDVKSCQFALVMLNSVIVVLGSEFSLWTFTVSHSGRYMKDCL